MCVHPCGQGAALQASSRAPDQSEQRPQTDTRFMRLDWQRYVRSLEFRRPRDGQRGVRLFSEQAQLQKERCSAALVSTGAAPAQQGGLRFWRQVWSLHSGTVSGWRSVSFTIVADWRGKRNAFTRHQCSVGRPLVVKRKFFGGGLLRVVRTAGKPRMTLRLVTEPVQRVPERRTRPVQQKVDGRRLVLYVCGLGLAALLGVLLWPATSQSATQGNDSGTGRRYGLSLRAPRPASVGKGQVNRCPSYAQNCISSRSEPGARSFEPPWQYPGNWPAEEALDLVRQAIQTYPGPETTKIIQYTPGRYLYAEFQTRLMGFVDDVECAVDASAHLIHYRSASRIGRSDMGANRARVQKLFAELNHRGLTLLNDSVAQRHGTSPGQRA
jgi:uncharacterized protein (DUF1499 family)